MKLSPAQQALFWRAFAPAWQTYCNDHSVSVADRKSSDVWRHAILFQECGCTSLAEVDRGAAFDRLLKRLAVEARDYARAADMEAAEAGRIRQRCEDCIRQIGEIIGEPHDTAVGWNYIAGILGRAYAGRAWNDIPERDLAKVFMMLDSRRRELLKRAGWRGARVCPDEPLSYVAGTRYRRAPGRVVIVREVPA
jgi:hypothetical protein